MHQASAAAYAQTADLDSPLGSSSYVILQREYHDSSSDGDVAASDSDSCTEPSPRCAEKDASAQPNNSSTRSGYKPSREWRYHSGNGFMGDDAGSMGSGTTVPAAVQQAMAGLTTGSHSRAGSLVNNDVDQLSAKHGIIWFPTGITQDVLRSAEEYPTLYEHTVTGATRKKKRDQSRQRGPLCLLVSCFQVTKQRSNDHCVLVVGTSVVVNGTELSIFRIGDENVAVDALCRHMGGPLYLGDIEDIGDVTCIVCPWHGWAYAVETGLCITRPDEKIRRYPLQVHRDGQILVGFDRIMANVFQDDDF